MINGNEYPYEKAVQVLAADLAKPLPENLPISAGKILLNPVVTDDLKPVISLSAYNKEVRLNDNLAALIGVWLFAAIFGAGGVFVAITFAPLLGVILGGIGVLAGIISFGGVIERIEMLDLRKLARQRSVDYLRAWLKHHYGILNPVTSASLDKLVEIINSSSFELRLSNNGHEYLLRRKYHMAEVTLEHTTGTLRTVNRISNPQPKQSAQPGIASLKAKQAKAVNVDTLAPFDKENRYKVQESLNLVTELRAASDLGVEQQFNLERDERSLNELINLAARLHGLPKSARAQGFVDLIEALNHVHKDLMTLNQEREQAALKDASILAHYTKTFTDPDRLHL